MNKPTILVVEDDVPVRCLITTTLKTHGYKYLTASNGETAIMMTTSHNPDIMLLDLGLPDIDGIEVIRSVRTWSNLPIIVLSARSEDSDKIEALDNGADDYLTKPFSVDELLARLRVTQRRLNLLASDGINSPVFVNGPLKIDFSAGCVWLSENELHLTHIMRQHTQQIWGSTQENDIASLRVYMASLRKKLERCPDAPHLIQTHVGVGYRMLRVENDEA
jgi:two-component system KDP operon response regulator KdpE